MCPRHRAETNCADPFRARGRRATIESGARRRGRQARRPVGHNLIVNGGKNVRTDGDPAKRIETKAAAQGATA